MYHSIPFSLSTRPSQSLLTESSSWRNLGFQISISKHPRTLYHPIPLHSTAPSPSSPLAIHPGCCYSWSSSRSSSRTQVLTPNIWLLYRVGGGFRDNNSQQSGFYSLRTRVLCHKNPFPPSCSSRQKAKGNFNCSHCTFDLSFIVLRGCGCGWPWRHLGLCCTAPFPSPPPFFKVLVQEVII